MTRPLCLFLQRSCIAVRPGEPAAVGCYCSYCCHCCVCAGRSRIPPCCLPDKDISSMRYNMKRVSTWNMSILGTVFSCRGETHLHNFSVLSLLILTGCAPASLNMALGSSPFVRGFVNSCNSDNAAAALSLPLTAWVGCGRGGSPFHRPVHPSFYRDLQLPKHDLRSCKCLCSSPSPTLSPQFLVILSDIGRQIVPSHRVPSSTVAAMYVTGRSHLSLGSSLDFGVVHTRDKRLGDSCSSVP